MAQSWNRHQAPVHAHLRARQRARGTRRRPRPEIIAIQPAYPFENLVYFLVVVAVAAWQLRGPFVAALLIGIADTPASMAAAYALSRSMSPPCHLLWRPAGLSETRMSTHAEATAPIRAPLDRVAALDRRNRGLLRSARVSSLGRAS